MSSKLPSNVTRMGDATVIRDEDASNPVAVRFDHVTKQYKLFRTTSCACCPPSPSAFRTIRSTRATT